VIGSPLLLALAFLIQLLTLLYVASRRPAPPAVMIAQPVNPEAHPVENLPEEHPNLPEAGAMPLPEAGAMPLPEADPPADGQVVQDDAKDDPLDDGSLNKDGEKATKVLQVVEETSVVVEEKSVVEEETSVVEGTGVVPMPGEWRHLAIRLENMGFAAVDVASALVACDGNLSRAALVLTAVQGEGEDEDEDVDGDWTKVTSKDEQIDQGTTQEKEAQNGNQSDEKDATAAGAAASRSVTLMELQDMGFDGDDASAALLASNGDMKATIRMLVHCERSGRTDNEGQ